LGDLLPNEDRELLIRLAELQTDIQINLTLCLGIVATCIVGIVWFADKFFTFTAEQPVLEIMAFVFMVVLGITMCIVERRYIKKVRSTRKQLTELKNQYRNENKATKSRKR